MKINKLMFIVLGTVAMTAAQAQEVRVLSGRNSIVVRQTGTGTQQYQLKTGGKTHSFSLTNTEDYRVNGLAEKAVNVVLTSKKGNLTSVTKGKVQVYGERFEASLPSQFQGEAFLDREVDELTLKAPSLSPMGVGAQITYHPLRGQTATRLLKGNRITVVTQNNNVTLRLAYLPEGCADTLLAAPVQVSAQDISLMEKWAGFQLPKKITVEVDDSTLHSPAITRYAKILKGKAENEDWKPEIEHTGDDTNIFVGDDYSDFYNRVILRVLNVLYTPDDSIFIVNEMVNAIGAMTKAKDGFDGGIPAYCGGRPNNNIIMKLNIPYLENYYKRFGWDALANEQWGIFLHELCHAYQKSPRRSRHRDDHAIAIEGIADAVRFTAKGFGEKERIEAGLQGARSEKRWLTPYRISACFLMWLRNFDGDFIRKFEKSIATLPDWTVEKGIHAVLGPQYDVEWLWNKYIEEVTDEAREKGYLK